MYFGEKLINSQLLKEMKNYIQAKLKNITWGGGPKMAEKQDGETTFSSTNSSKEHLNADQIPQNNF